MESRDLAWDVEDTFGTGEKEGRISIKVKFACVGQTGGSG